AQAVFTNSEMDNPESSIVFFKEEISSSLINVWLTSGIGSCQSSSSLGTSGPRYLETGPISRCVNLYQARAKASSNSSGFSRKCNETFLYAGSIFKAISAVLIINSCVSDGLCAIGARCALEAAVGFHWCAPAGLF